MLGRGCWNGDYWTGECWAGDGDYWTGECWAGDVGLVTTGQVNAMQGMLEW